VFKKITKKVYSTPSIAYKSISFRVPEDHNGVLTSEKWFLIVVTFRDSIFLRESLYWLMLHSLYHLKEWARGNRKPVNAKELYNLRHASARNLAERVLGITKEKFPILSTMMEYDFPTQRDMVLCCLLLHNFIRKTNLFDKGFQYANDVVEETEEDEEAAEGEYAVVDGNIFRDNIANAMWNQYVAYCLANNNEN
jgi:hypothetical protein